LQLSELPQVTVGSGTYRAFLLDINQKSSQPLLSLDQLRLYVAGAPNLTGYDGSKGRLAGLDPVYDMDAGRDASVKLNYLLNSGSGSGDMRLLVPEAAFAGAGANPYVYLYSEFGEYFAANAGFQEWAPGPGATAAPLTAGQSASLSGALFVDANH